MLYVMAGSRNQRTGRAGKVTHGAGCRWHKVEGGGMAEPESKGGGYRCKGCRQGTSGYVELWVWGTKVVGGGRPMQLGHAVGRQNLYQQWVWVRGAACVSKGAAGQCVSQNRDAYIRSSESLCRADAYAHDV